MGGGRPTNGDSLNFNCEDESDSCLLTEESLITLVHELRSPLLVFEFGLSALEDQLHNSFYSETLRMMRRQLQTAQRLLTEAAQLTNSAPRHVRVKKERCDVSLALTEIALDLRPLFVRKEVLLVTDIQPGVEAFLDPLHLRQIMNNLLNNAARYSEPGAHVALRCIVSEGGTALEISVEDSGVGIDENEIAQIFDPFFRGTQSDAAPGGLGLGLSVVERLVTANEGTIRAASPGLGQGSTFTVSLPLSSVGL
jgi:signal transduction histidine kinase